MGDKVNVLFTCVGRRVGLVRAFQRAAEGLKIRCTTVGTDANPYSPGLYVCHKGAVTKPISHKANIAETLAVVKKHKIDLVIPTIDPELMHLARHREQFEALGARVLVSSLDVLEICQDKRNTYRFLVDHGFQTPSTAELSKVRTVALKFPVFLKPYDGSASKGSAVVRNREEFRYMSRRIPHCIVQELIEGQEYTCDVYVDLNMQVRTVVPRKRMEIRGGEVSKGQTVKIPRLMDACRRLVETLKAGPGVITIQCFLTKDNCIKFIEINPRFGGGAPLSIQAGADFPRWILSEMIGKRPRVRFDGWRDGLCMLRFDEACWVESSRIIK